MFSALGEGMRYGAFSRACRALEISAEDFRDRETLALALERSVDATNAPTIVRLLAQISEDDFDLSEAKRAFLEQSLEVAWKIDAWAPLDLNELPFYCGIDTSRFSAWLKALPADLQKAILSFFDAPSHRFLLMPELCGAAVRLTVHDASLELSYSLPERFDLDPSKAHATAIELLRHLKIGTLYHEILAASREVDVEKIFALLAGEASASPVAQQIRR